MVLSSCLVPVIWTTHSSAAHALRPAAVCCAVSCRSQEGSQFCRGFGGVGGILRYQVGLDAGHMAHFARGSGVELSSETAAALFGLLLMSVVLTCLVGLSVMCISVTLCSDALLSFAVLCCAGEPGRA